MCALENVPLFFFLRGLQRSLLPDEDLLLNSYRKLNDLGKGKAREDVSDLTEIPKYTEPDYPETLAAHFDGEELTAKQKAAVERFKKQAKR